MKRKIGDDAITVLELIFILLAVVVAAIFIIHILTPSHDSVPQGLVADAIGESGDSVRMIGDPFGYSSKPRTNSGFDSIPKVHDEHAIGSVQVSISPLIGDLAIDMDTTIISTVIGDKETTLSQKKRSPLNPGDWAIISRYGNLPLGSANDDDILHSGETFDLLIVLPEPLHPYEQFTLTITPYRGLSLPIRRTVPPVVTGVTQLPDW